MMETYSDVILTIICKKLSFKGVFYLCPLIICVSILAGEQMLEIFQPVLGLSLFLM